METPEHFKVELQFDAKLVKRCLAIIGVEFSPEDVQRIFFTDITPMDLTKGVDEDMTLQMVLGFVASLTTREIQSKVENKPKLSRFQQKLNDMMNMSSNPNKNKDENKC